MSSQQVRNVCVTHYCIWQPINDVTVLTRTRHGRPSTDTIRQLLPDVHAFAARRAVDERGGNGMIPRFMQHDGTSWFHYI